ncbi:MAG: hypothetical protein LBV69_11980 [Bacteroidales bacterium]|jgi:hypothetical protein|nr:hypothetical protein [Bacteroidales bacterium]
MKDKIFLIIAIISLVLVCSTCWPDRPPKIKVINNANYPICVFCTYQLFDTILPIIKPTLLEIEAKKYDFITGYMADNNDVWFERIFDDTLHIFIMNNDTIKKYSWNNIRNGNFIFAHYKMKLKQNEENKMIIYYPQ